MRELKTKAEDMHCSTREIVRDLGLFIYVYPTKGQINFSNFIKRAVGTNGKKLE